MTNRINVTCELRTYDGSAPGSVIVKSHWNESGKVVLELDGKRYTVVAKDLRAAIDNCTNAG